MRTPRPLRTDGSNRFARHTMAVRLPSIIDELLVVNPDYPSSIGDSLRRLKEELLEDRPLRSPSPPAPDWEGWIEQADRHRGESWLGAEWFFAEHLFYRRIIETVRWWENGRDPFAPVKEEQYAGEGYRLLLEAAAGRLLEAAAPEERLAAHLLSSLWGNRIDLSYKASAALGAASARSEELIVDERGPLLERLFARGDKASAVHIVTDNTGSELSMDLLLAGSLTALGFTVVFHVKMHPTYVSDATAPDVVEAIRQMRLPGRPDAVRAEAARIAAAFDAGAIRIAPDLYWNSGRFLAELPERIARTLRGARLLILKGDVNYRRLSGDAIWPQGERPRKLPPVPTALLRAMKSDTLLEFPPGLVERLDREDPEWKSNGRRGIVQLIG